MKSITYHASKKEGEFEVTVTPTMEALGDQLWHVRIIPDKCTIPVGEYSANIEESSGFGAASEAMDRYSEFFHLDGTTVWSL